MAGEWTQREMEELTIAELELLASDLHMASLHLRTTYLTRWCPLRIT